MSDPVSTPQSAIDWAGTEQALVDWVREAVDVEAIWANEDGPQPDRPYVVLDWLAPPSPVGQDYFDTTYDVNNDVLEQTLQGIREGTVTVRVECASTRAGENAFYFCDVLYASLLDEFIVRRHFTPMRMAVWGVDEPQKLDNFEGGKAVSRAAFDVRFGFSAGTGETSRRIDYISTVSITGTVSEGSGSVVSATAVTS